MAVTAENDEVCRDGISPVFSIELVVYFEVILGTAMLAMFLPFYHVTAQTCPFAAAEVTQIGTEERVPVTIFSLAFTVFSNDSCHGNLICPTYP